jgi:hypothetical protein
MSLLQCRKQLLEQYRQKRRLSKQADVMIRNIGGPGNDMALVSFMNDQSVDASFSLAKMGNNCGAVLGWGMYTGTFGHDANGSGWVLRRAMWVAASAGFTMMTWTLNSGQTPMRDALLAHGFEEVVSCLNRRSSNQISLYSVVLPPPQDVQWDKWLKPKKKVCKPVAKKVCKKKPASKRARALKKRLSTGGRLMLL